MRKREDGHFISTHKSITYLLVDTQCLTVGLGQHTAWVLVTAKTWLLANAKS